MGFLHTIIVLCLCRSSISIDWCDESLDCEAPNGTSVMVIKSTLCRDTEHESKSECYHMVKRSTSSVQKILLAMHNTFRNEIAGGTILHGWPTASNMRQMSWDDSLAEQALRWAFQCDDKESDPCKTHPVYKEDEGQNYGKFVQSSAVNSPDVEHAFRKWIQEASVASPAIVASMTPGYYLRFAQIIYSEVFKVGCGVIDYQDVGKKAIRVVCNYNVEYVMGETLYKQGELCKYCSSGTSCKSGSSYPNLCALESDPVDETPYLVSFDEPMEKVTDVGALDEKLTTVPASVSTVEGFQPPVHGMSVLRSYRTLLCSGLILVGYFFQ